MSESSVPILREQLIDRRNRLQTAAPAPEVLRLLDEVDRALDRMDKGTYGICQVCHDPIEEDRLLADPLLCFCLDHLDTVQRRELEDDLNLARQIQRSLLPPCRLVVAGWEACYHYEAVGAIGGDYCDLIRCNEGASLFFLTGDVSGKGVAAALLMSHLNAICRTLLAGASTVQVVLEQVNRLFCNSTTSPHYATLVCGRAEPSGEVEIGNAGHCPPILLRDGRAQILDAGGLPVGLFCNMSYTTHRIQLEPGEHLILYTDGVTEAANAEGEEYGIERFQETLTRVWRQTAGDVAEGAVADVRRFAGRGRRFDDLTILALRRIPDL